MTSSKVRKFESSKVDAPKSSQPIGERRTLVLLDTATATDMPDKVAALKQQGVVIKAVDYNNLMSHVEELRQVVQEHQINFVLFARNDQVFDRVSIGPMIRALKVGYSTFSGIDPDQAVEQTRVCLDDYLRGKSELPVPPARNSQLATRNSQLAGTFSLIFDFEQMACARFGLPRILDLLDQYGAKATFFTTNFIPEMYTNALDIVAGRGHEVGLHGLFHEYMSGEPLDRQTESIRQMKVDFERTTKVTGANFIGRTDADTVSAMIANGLDYFVLFMEHRYSPFSYRKMPLQPMRVWSPQGGIWLMPISVETNNRPWFTVKNVLDSAIAAGRVESWPHVNILMHPFRDGSLSHIGDVERLLEHLQGKLGYRGVPIADAVKQLPRHEPASYVYFGLEGAGRKQGEHKVRSYRRSWWHNTARYQQRVYNLYQALAHEGRQPALCLEAPSQGSVYAVHPTVPDGIKRVNTVEEDPLLFSVRSPKAKVQSFPMQVTGQEPSLTAFVPKGYEDDMVNAIQALRPRFQQDYTGLFPELALRAAYRLSAGRHIF